jgi:hypothetical protein
LATVSLVASLSWSRARRAAPDRGGGIVRGWVGGGDQASHWMGLYVLVALAGTAPRLLFRDVEQVGVGQDVGSFTAVACA